MQYLTVKEVSQRIGVTEKTVRSYIEKGELKAYKLGTSWKITEENLQTFIESKSNIKKETN
ncbi:helix-turn-helix domain-containing protein [Lysinibacillus fusiformis]|uniref:helix-turn-helix domain-containing protein n=1 Tax=Lysinibacillus fusiformis TaxID=28031 RepID=UPI003D0433DE